MNLVVNLDLLSVGIAIAAIGILGFTVFLNNRKSITNKTFLFLCISVIAWSLLNYLFYQVSIPQISFWLLKFVMFFAVVFAFSIFQLLYVFPKEKIKFPKWYTRLLLPTTVVTAILTLTPLVFSKILAVSQDGKILKLENNIGIVIFGIVVLFLNFGGISILMKKVCRASGLAKRQYSTILAGVLTTLLLIIIFNFILPAFFDNPRFIPLGAVFIFPFIAFTSYAIVKYHLLNVKIIATEVFTFILAVVTLFEVVVSKDVNILIFRSAVFLLVLVFGIMLIRSVHKEVEQREELERLTKKLAAANIKLERLDHARSQLLSITGHQVKSLLAAIKQFAELLLQGLYGPISKEVKETIQKMKLASEDLLELVSTLLDYRRIEDGKMEYEFKKVKLYDLVRRIVEALRPLADAKGIKLSLEGKTDAEISADATKFRQVVQNLVDNAIKYTPKGSVTVRLTEEKNLNSILIAVADTGLGIPPDLIPHLFEEFIRDKRIKNKIRGTGLGLYVARKIIESHGGHIWAESPGEGKGSTFYIRIRKA